MNDRQSLPIGKPKPLLLKPVTFNFKDMFKPLAKGIIAATSLDWKGAAQQAVDAAAALGLKDTPGELAWLLIQRAVIKAVYELAEEATKFSRATDEELNAASQSFTYEMPSKGLAIDDRFFDNPRTFEQTGEIVKAFKEWLQHIGIDPAQAEAISERYPRYFVKALHDEWKSDRSRYEAILNEFETPFADAYRAEFAWKRYFAWLRRQVCEPMLEEAFGIDKVYIHLRAYYKKTVESRRSRGRADRCEPGQEDCAEENVVVMLHAAVKEWIASDSRKDAIRIVCGGPGCGKSSFAKMLAAELAEKERRVLFFALHMIDANADFTKSVSDYLREGEWFDTSPLDVVQDKPLLIILDGLDELAMQGRTGIEAAKCFLEHMKRTLELCNQQRLKLKILITGRDLVVQAAEAEYRLADATLHALPYHATNTSMVDGEFSDKGELLDIDLRDEWWTAYGKATGKGYQGMPEDLHRNRLDEITAQPLLNYLVALTLKDSKRSFTETNLNTIYYQLLKDVYKRAWADNRRPWVGELSEPQFQRVMEEIAVSVWHGDGRKTTIKEIREHCESGNTHKLLDKFQEGVEKGLIRLLTAFYFRRAISRGETETFEFTHKSFGEYLVARKIVRAIGLFCDKYIRSRDNYEEGWSEKEALKSWAEICGPRELDRYLFVFIRDEVRINEPEVVKRWQTVIQILISYELRHGFPMESFRHIDFKEQCRQSRNAEEALFVALDACSSVTQDMKVIEWPAATSFGELLSRLQPQRDSISSSISFKCFNRLSAPGQVIVGRDLSGVYSTREASYRWLVAFARRSTISFSRGDFRGADFRGANLVSASFLGASLQEARLVGANLERANLMNANLTKANLMNANLGWANLEGANLEGANLKGANLQGANLLNAYLKGANFKGANFAKTKLDPKYNHLMSDVKS